MRKLLVASVVSLACGGALADINVFSAALLGANECTSGAPAVCGVGDPDGFGAATVLIDTASNTVSWSFMALSIDPPSAAHIHAGPAGANGPVIIDFSAMAFGTVVDVDAASITPVTAANFYVNVHNPAYPGGAIRGQLTFERTVSPIPEPATYASLLGGLALLGALARRRRS